MKRISKIFLTSFILNLMWENLHSYFYANYQGGNITEFVLLRASLFDALLITLVLLPFVWCSFLKNKTWLMLIIITGIAIINEWYGLHTNRWAYNELMPVIPIIATGLTPTIQLGLMGYITLKIQKII